MRATGWSERPDCGGGAGGSAARDTSSSKSIAAEVELDGRVVISSRRRRRLLDDAFIAAYIEAMGEAALYSPGAYQIEGLGAHLFSQIKGCHYAILGLPLLQILGFLRPHGLAPNNLMPIDLVPGGLTPAGSSS